MSPTRRHAALGLLAAGGAALPAARAFAADPVIELPDAEAPDTKVGLTQSRFDHMLAPVNVNGQGPFAFLIDTGANTSCVSHRLAEKLSLTAAETARVHTVVGVRERPVVTLDELQIGPRNRKRVRAPALPIKGAEVDGILGVDWLKGQRLVLDFKDRRMEITKSRPDQSEAGKVVVVPARRRHGQLTIVDADLGGQRISAIIDTGAQTTMCNDKLAELAKASQTKRGAQAPPPRIVRMETLAGESFVGEALFLPFLRLGGLHLGNVPVTHADTHVFKIWDLKDVPALVLGIDLLAQFDQVALDFGRSRVRFDFV
jgi:predicted aspartyl protease